MKTLEQNKFKEQSIKDTQLIVDQTYKNWMSAKIVGDNNMLNILSDTIYMCCVADIKNSNFSAKENYWFEVFKDEKLIIDKLLRL